MKRLRSIHAFLGCAFAPLILYFALSGAWQAFRLNDLPKDEPASALRGALHELSKPHKSAALPGADAKTESSVAFKIASAALGLALAATTALGLAIAYRTNRSRKAVIFPVALGLLIPILLLWMR